MRAVKVFCAAAALVAFMAPGAHADEWNKRTYLTFSGPVSIPGATLPAGTYTFELADPDMTRHVVRVSEKDSGKHVGLFLTIPNDRLDPPDENLIMFSERPAGSPQAIQVWFYPGDRIGEEFVYPKSQALAIAKATHKSVLATDDSKDNTNTSESERMTAMRGASVGRVDENGKMTDEPAPKTTTASSANKAQSATTTTADANKSNATAAPSAQTNTAASATNSRANTARSNTARTTTARSDRSNQSVGTSGTTAGQNAQNNAAGNRRELPRTASNLPAMLLLSVLSLLGAAGVHQLRRAAATR